MGNKTIWFLGTTATDTAGDHALYCCINGGLNEAGAATGLAVVGSTAYAVNASDQVYAYTSDAFGWSSTQQSSVIAADGSVWFLGTAIVDKSGDHAIYRFSSGQFAQIPGSATTLTLNGAGIVGKASSGGFSLLDGSPGREQPGSISMSNGQISIVGFNNATNTVSVTLDIPPAGLYLTDPVPTYTVHLYTTLNGLSLTPLVYQRTFTAQGIYSVAITSGSGEVNSVSVPAGLSTSGFQAFQINGLPGGTPQTTNTCGPNSAWRVIQAYGGAATYQELIDNCSEESIVSKWNLGTTGATLVSAMNSDLRGFDVPIFSLRTNSGIQDVINCLQQGKPVVAMIRVPGSVTVGQVGGEFGKILGGLGGNGGYTLPQFHWIAVMGFNPNTGSISYVDTNGYEYQESPRLSPAKSERSRDRRPPPTAVQVGDPATGPRKQTLASFCERCSGRVLVFPATEKHLH